MRLLKRSEPINWAPPLIRAETQGRVLRLVQVCRRSRPTFQIETLECAGQVWLRLLVLEPNRRKVLCHWSSKEGDNLSAADSEAQLLTLIRKVPQVDTLKDRLPTALEGWATWTLGIPAPIADFVQGYGYRVQFEAQHLKVKSPSHPLKLSTLPP